MKWDYFGCSHIGKMHKKLSICNQDAWIFKQFKWGFCAVVSDGLGSKKRSEIGSRLACKAVIHASEIYAKENIINIDDFINAIITYWKYTTTPYDTNQCAATCLFVCNINNKVLLGRIGDGIIIALGNSKNKILSDTKDGSFSNITVALSEKVRMTEWEFYVEDECLYDSFLMATDGIADDLIPSSQEDFAREFIAYYSNLTKKKRYNEIKSFLSHWPVKGSSDDKTVLGVIRI